MVEWFLGTMGFGYDDWRGVFYPPGTTSRDYLTHSSRIFYSVEMDTTFYGVPRSAVVTQWAASTPDNFKFCAKLPRTITHEMGLIGTRGLVDEFIDAMRLLGDKLGVILIQFPPSFTSTSLPALEAFLKDIPTVVRFAVEFRHRSWYTPQTVELLTAHRICWAAIEFPRLPNQINITTDFLYIRWIGKHGSYTRHTHERVDRSSHLKWWWETIKLYLDRVDSIYGFFNNDYAGFAAGTCNRFKIIAGLPVENIQTPKQQRLF